MATNKKSWVIRTAQGKLLGPLTTEEVLKCIGEGELIGDEQISLYPSSKWFPISQDPYFYDKLLEGLAARESSSASFSLPDIPLESSAKNKNQSKEEAKRSSASKQRPSQDTPRPVANNSDVTPTPRVDHTSVVKGSVKRDSIQDKLKSQHKTKDKVTSVIELVDVRKLTRIELIKKAALPLGVGVLLLISLLFLLPSSQKEGDRVRLILPREGQGVASEEQIQQRTQRGVRSYLQDTFSGYITAQNELVQAIEGGARHYSAMALLCLTYWELWGFAYQDSQDLRVVSGLAQMASALEPASVDAATCRAVDLLVRARYSEAKSLTESIIEAHASKESPPIAFFYLKAILLEAERNYVTAAGYAKSAHQLWPQWTRAQVLEAQLRSRIGNDSEAANIYRQILQRQPDHPVARVELGVLEFQSFRQAERGEELLKSGLRSGERISPLVVSRGYRALAEIALQRGNETEALRYAQQAYAHNSGDETSKNLIVRLGGVERLRKTEVSGSQLVYEGDQLVREGDCHAAQALYKAAFEQSGQAVAAMKAARCLWELSFSTEAIEWLNKAIRADPKLIEAYVLMADYYTQRFDFLAASRILATAERAVPNSYEVFRGFALAELRRHNPQAAIAYGKKALSLYETDVETHIVIAEAHLALRENQLAYAAAARAIELDLNSRRGQAVYAQALAGVQGMVVGIDYLRDLVTTYPMVIDYRLALGNLLLEDERYSAAEDIFRQIILLDQKPKEAFLKLGKVLRLQGKVEEALEALLRAAVVDPADAEPLFQAGLLYLQVRKPREAIVQFERVLRINQRYPRAHYHKGLAALQMKNPKEALAQADREKRINPNLADAYLLAAEAYSEMKQYSLCASEYQKAIQLRPQGAGIYVKLAQCYRLSGNLDVAMSMLNHAATQESGNPDIYKEQGAIYEMRGDLQHAIEAYNQYFILDPNAPDRAQIESRIRALQSGSSI